MSVGVITAISNAVAGVSQVYYEWLKSSERRKMQAAIEAAEKYIFVNEKAGSFSGITDERKERLLSHYRKRFFHYN